MWTLTKFQWLVILSLFVIGSGAGWLVYAAGANARDAELCDQQFSSDSDKLACWYRVLETRVVNHSVSNAMGFFSYVYDHYPSFVRVGCHAHAHKL